MRKYKLALFIGAVVLWLQPPSEPMEQAAPETIHLPARHLGPELFYLQVLFHPPHGGSAFLADRCGQCGCSLPARGSTGIKKAMHR